jgi:hypothetical protein
LFHFESNAIIERVFKNKPWPWLFHWFTQVGIERCARAACA